MVLYAIAATIITAVGCYLLSFPYCFVRNVINARRSGFSSIWVPVDQNHFLWMVTSVSLRPWLERNLPPWLYSRVVLSIYGNEFHVGLEPFEKLAGNTKSYFLVTAGQGEFWTADPEINSWVLSKPEAFEQLDLSSLFMAKFGHNVLTSNGQKWSRQRKIVASVINERISKAVFLESLRQVEELLRCEVPHDTLKSPTDLETVRLFDWLKRITIHVLSSAGMGASVSWNTADEVKPSAGFRFTYNEAVNIVIENLTGPLILPGWFLDNYPSMLPGHKTLNKLSFAVKEFPNYLKQMLNQERERSSHTKQRETRGNIMSQLLQASEKSSSTGQQLTEEEMVGNLFIFTAAGFDTTANTLAYATALLARYSQWQDWVLEEVDSLMPCDTPTAALEYTDIHPKAVRTLCVMLETLRLFPPVIHLAKQTRTPQAIKTSRGEYWLPGNTIVYINQVALGLDPATFRNVNLQPNEQASDDDEKRFRPSRWMNVKTEDGSNSEKIPSIWQPPKGTYVPWSTGPRVCPGQKMAQVEFVAVIMGLLRRHRIESVLLPGESLELMERRLDTTMRKSISMLTLQMEGIYDVNEQAGEGLKMRLKSRKVGN